MPRLVVISNRVAVPKARGAAGAQGGLAGALNAALKDEWRDLVRLVRAGDRRIHRVDQLRQIVTTASPPRRSISNTQDIEEYYNGYANSTLWPLFHYRIDLTEYEREFGKGYERVNERFAESVAAADRATTISSGCMTIT